MGEKKRGFKRGSRSEDELERAFSEGYAAGKRGECGFEDIVAITRTPRLLHEAPHGIASCARSAVAGLG
jgi:hypothetical protein